MLSLRTYVVGSPQEGRDPRLEGWGRGGGVWHSAFSTGDAMETWFPGIGVGAGGGGGGTADPVACVGAGLEPEAVWCSLIEYRSQSIPRGHARVGREGSEISPWTWKLGTPPNPEGLLAVPCTQPTWFAKEEGNCGGWGQDLAAPM